MTTEEAVLEDIQKASKENNEVEKTISLQLIAVATFLATVLGTFIAVPGLKPLGLPQKIFVLLDIVFLFISMGCGVIHLLIVKSMFEKAYKQAQLALRVLRRLSTNTPAQEKRGVVSEIHADLSAIMIFFYSQIAALAISVTIFLGIIVTLLF